MFSSILTMGLGLGRGQGYLGRRMRGTSLLSPFSPTNTNPSATCSKYSTRPKFLGRRKFRAQIASSCARRYYSCMHDDRGLRIWKYLLMSLFYMHTSPLAYHFNSQWTCPSLCGLPPTSLACSKSHCLSPPVGWHAKLCLPQQPCHLCGLVEAEVWRGRA